MSEIPIEPESSIGLVDVVGVSLALLPGTLPNVEAARISRQELRSKLPGEVCIARKSATQSDHTWGIESPKGIHGLFE